MRALLFALMVLLAAPCARAQAVPDVAASAPVARSVTIYRAPGRNGGDLRLDGLRGFAVITETRDVFLPAGLARLRFGGVVEGIVPQSAIVTGLPGGVIEKNRDDALLSPSTLMRATLGHTLVLTRTSRKTGKVTRTPAQLVSASDQGVVFATAEGTETLRCSGLPETFAFGDGTEGLSAQPTLSVRTRSPRAVRARVQLTYLAENFDWAANYVAHLRPDGRTLDLTGWITLANGNGVSLPGAQTQIVAGRLNRAMLAAMAPDQPRVIARCWPMETTSDIPERQGPAYALVQPWTRPVEEIMVTAMRKDFRVPAPALAMAPPPAPPPPPAAEQLGDLKLYRLPEPTTIAARQMKQSRLLDQPGVPVETVWRLNAWLNPWQASAPPTAAITVLRSRNDKAHGLGLPLPAGTVLVEQDQAGRPALLGQPALADTAQDEKLELTIGQTPDITGAWASGPADDKVANLKLTLANAAPHPAPVEVRLMAAHGWIITHGSATIPMIDGTPTLSTTLASGETRVVDIRLVRQ